MGRLIGVIAGGAIAHFTTTIHPTVSNSLLLALAAFLSAFVSNRFFWTPVLSVFFGYLGPTVLQDVLWPPIPKRVLIEILSSVGGAALGYVALVALTQRR